VLRVQDDTTRRLTETRSADALPKMTAIRWTLPNARTFVSLIERPRQSLGRGENEDVRLEAAGVSRSHAEIEQKGPVYALRDRDSTNGTHVNGQRITQTALAPGDVIRLGDAIGVVVHGNPDEITVTEVEVIDGAVFGPGLRTLLSSLRRVAPSALPVVITGETGAGKEAVARTLHRFSALEGPFHAVNCAALPATLAEAELFGYRKGAFTGAEQASAGHLRAAHRGTLFLDELADLPLPVQAKLLRSLQNGEISPLGDTKAHKVDVRLIAAMQRPPAELVAEHRLREDLAMRLCGLVLTLPPLRKRREDIPPLVQTFLERHTGGRAPSVEPRLLERLLCYDWPGNVRELELLLRQLVALHGHEPTLRRSMLPPELSLGSAARSSSRPLSEERGRDQEELERLTAELSNNGGNVARAAASVGISRSRAYRLLGDREPPGRRRE
jgi:transcriptional regulator with GAF, ATPase, and Fis domain